MRCKILNSFDYSHNGIDIENAEAGTTTDIPDHMVEGLAADGFLARPGTTDEARAADAVAPENKMLDPDTIEKVEDWAAGLNPDPAEPDTEPTPDLEAILADEDEDEDETPEDAAADAEKMTELEQLRAEYLEQAGEEADGRWGVRKLKKMLGR